MLVLSTIMSSFIISPYFMPSRQLVEDRLRSLPQAMPAVGADPSNQEQLFLLRSKFTEIVAGLLRILLLQVNSVNSGRVDISGGPEAFCQNIAYLLDKTNLETPVSPMSLLLSVLFKAISLSLGFSYRRAFGDQTKITLATLRVSPKRSERRRNRQSWEKRA